MSKWLLRDDFQLMLNVTVLVALIAIQVVDKARTWRRRAAREARVTARLSALRERVWAGGAICDGLEPDDGVLLARAARQARTAAAAEEHARACVGMLEKPDGDDRTPPPPIADLAGDAEARLAARLDRLRQLLPPPAAAELEQAQAAWRDYRDLHVRLCRELPGPGADRWPVRHLASEAVTAARIEDLEDLLGICRLRP